MVSRGSVAEKFDSVETKYSRFWRGSSSWALSGPLTFDLRIRLLVASTSRVALSSEMLAKNPGMLSYSESVLMILDTAWFYVSTWLNNDTAVANSCHPISSVPQCNVALRAKATSCTTQRRENHGFIINVFTAIHSDAVELSCTSLSKLSSLRTRSLIKVIALLLLGSPAPSHTQTFVAWP